MKLRSDKELLTILFIEPFKFNPDALTAAEIELKERNIKDLEALKASLIKDNFYDLSEYEEDDLIDYVDELSVEKSMANKEIIYHLKMGKVAEDAVKAFEKALNLDAAEKQETNTKQKNKDIMLGSLLLIVGLSTTFISFTDAGSTGTYFVTSGALFAGGFKLIRGLFS